MSQTPEPTPPPLPAVATWVALIAVGWYLIYLVLPVAMFAVGMSRAIWMLPIVFILVTVAYYVGGRVLGRLIGRRAWLWAILAAGAPIVIELATTLIRGEWVAEVPWADGPIRFALQLMGPLAALFGANSAREANAAR